MAYTIFTVYADANSISFSYEKDMKNTKPGGCASAARMENDQQQ